MWRWQHFQFNKFRCKNCRIWVKDYIGVAKWLIYDFDRHLLFSENRTMSVQYVVCRRYWRDNLEGLTSTVVSLLCCLSSTTTKIENLHSYSRIGKQFVTSELNENSVAHKDFRMEFILCRNRVSLSSQYRSLRKMHLKTVDYWYVHKWIIGHFLFSCCQQLMNRFIRRIIFKIQMSNVLKLKVQFKCMTLVELNFILISSVIRIKDMSKNADNPK
jgi:hypothetical protein